MVEFESHGVVAMEDPTEQMYFLQVVKLMTEPGRSGPRRRGLA